MVYRDRFSGLLYYDGSEFYMGLYNGLCAGLGL